MYRLKKTFGFELDVDQQNIPIAYKPDTPSLKKQCVCYILLVSLVMPSANILLDYRLLHSLPTKTNSKTLLHNEQ